MDLSSSTLLLHGVSIYRGQMKSDQPTIGDTFNQTGPLPERTCSTALLGPSSSITLFPSGINVPGICSTTFVGYAGYWSFLDVSRDSITVNDAGRFQIEAMIHRYVENTFVDSSVPKDDNLTSLFILLSKGGTYCNSIPPPTVD